MMATTNNAALLKEIVNASSFSSEASKEAYENKSYLDKLYEMGCDCSFEDVYGGVRLTYSSRNGDVTVCTTSHDIENDCPINSMSFCVNNTVYVDEKLELSVNAREFLFVHEAGHICNNHPSMLAQSYDRVLAVHNNSVLQFVLEADEYAVEILGKYAVHCALFELISKINDGYAKNELLMRAEIVSNM